MKIRYTLPRTEEGLRYHYIVSFDTYREGKVFFYIGILDEVPFFGKVHVSRLVG